nr:MAG TPA: upper collar protein [Bacteriophage sp.]
MERKLINSQLSNFKTYEMYKRQLLTLAENVFEFKNMPKYIDTAFLNKCLLRRGSIAFFVDDVLGLLALPYTILGKLDVYGRPNSIKVSSENGYTKTIKNRDDFVIMYDNNGRYPLWLDILQYSERIALDTRTTDINIAQQKTPRFWKTKTEKVKSIQDLVNNVDGMENTVISYDDLDLDDTTLVLAPAPFVADKIDLHKEKDWNEFLRLIGIANMNFQKKERNIKDEVLASQGGTIASRYSRFEPRQKAIDEINEKFKDKTTIDGKSVIEKELEVKYYDGVPTSKETDETDVEYDVESGVDYDTDVL